MHTAIFVLFNGIAQTRGSLLDAIRVAKNGGRGYVGVGTSLVSFW